jgi:hypothetical protein
MIRLLSAVLAGSMLLGAGSAFAGEFCRREVRKQLLLHREVRNEREWHGGRLSFAERARLNRQENRDSRQIFRAKHSRERF